MAVVCPGRERHCRSQGADGAERYCHAHATASSTGAARWGGAREGLGRCDEPGRRDTVNPPRVAVRWKRGLGHDPGRVRPQGVCGAHRDARRRFPDCIPLNTAAARDGYQVSLSRVGRKTTSVIGTITRRADPEAGLPVLILKIPNNPILQSRVRPDCNCGATQARPQECAYRLWNLKNCCAAAPRLRPLATVIQDSFSIDFAFWRGRWRRPCVKYRF